MNPPVLLSWRTARDPYPSKKKRTWSRGKQTSSGREGVNGRRIVPTLHSPFPLSGTTADKPPRLTCNSLRREGMTSRGHNCLQSEGNALMSTLTSADLTAIRQSAIRRRKEVCYHMQSRCDLLAEVGAITALPHYYPFPGQGAAGQRKHQLHGGWVFVSQRSGNSPPGELPQASSSWVRGAGESIWFLLCKCHPHIYHSSTKPGNKR